MHVQTLIVGAGPGGALLSYLLAKRGIHTLLLERTATLGQAFRGEHLNEEGEMILKKYDLYEAVEQIGCLPMTSLRYWHNGQLIKELTTHTHFGIHVPQTHLLQVLIEKATAYDNFSYQLGTSVKELLQREDGSYYGVVAVKDGKTQTITCDLLIGADGRYSTVRKKAGIDVKIIKHGYDLLWARIPAPATWQPSIEFALIDDFQLSIFTQTANYIQIGWQIAEGTFKDVRNQPFEPFKQRLCETMPQLAETITAHLHSWKDFILLDVYSSEVETWQKDGLVFLGDAVHTMTPTGAYGLNCALRDADILSDIIAGERMDTISYTQCETLRKTQVKEIQQLQRQKEASFADAFVVFA